MTNWRTVAKRSSLQTLRDFCPLRFILLPLLACFIKFVWLHADTCTDDTKERAAKAFGNCFPQLFTSHVPPVPEGPARGSTYCKVEAKLLPTSGYPRKSSWMQHTTYCRPQSALQATLLQDTDFVKVFCQWPSCDAPMPQPMVHQSWVNASKPCKPWKKTSDETGSLILRYASKVRDCLFLAIPAQHHQKEI